MRLSTNFYKNKRLKYIISHVKTTTSSPQNDLNLLANNTDIRQVIITSLLMLGRGKKCTAWHLNKNLSCQRGDVRCMSEWKQALMINQGGKICLLQMPSVPLIKSLLRNTDFITGEMLLCLEISHFTPLTSAINLAAHLGNLHCVLAHLFWSYWRCHHLYKPSAR